MREGESVTTTATGDSAAAYQAGSTLQSLGPNGAGAVILQTTDLLTTAPERLSEVRDLKSFIADYEARGAWVAYNNWVIMLIRKHTYLFDS